MAKEKKVKPIGDITATLLKLALNFSQNQLEKKVGDEDVRDGIMLAFPLAAKVIEVLNDDNPENDKQVRAELMASLNGPVADFIDRLLSEKIEKTDENLEAILTFLKDAVVDVFRLITDDDAQNNTQLEAFIDQLLRDIEFHDLVIEHIIVPIARKAGATEEWVDFLREVVQTTFDGLLKVKAAQLSAKLAEFQEEA